MLTVRVLNIFFGNHISLRIAEQLFDYNIFKYISLQQPFIKGTYHFHSTPLRVTRMTIVSANRPRSSRPSDQCLLSVETTTLHRAIMAWSINMSRVVIAMIALQKWIPCQQHSSLGSRNDDDEDEEPKSLFFPFDDDPRSGST